MYVSLSLSLSIYIYIYTHIHNLSERRFTLSERRLQFPVGSFRTSLLVNATCWLSLNMGCFKRDVHDFMTCSCSATIKPP